MSHFEVQMPEDLAAEGSKTGTEEDVTQSDPIRLS